MFTLTDVCRELSISPATGRNWIKLGKIKAEGKRGNSYAFSEEYVEQLKKELESGKRNSLKSRRNKTFISGKSLYRDYVSKKSKNLPAVENLIESLSQSDAKVTTTTPGNDSSETLSMLGRAILSNCAIRMIICRTYKKEEADQILNECIVSPLSDYLNHDLSIGSYDALIDDLILSHAGMQAFLLSQPELPAADLIYEPGEDILGLLYLSLRNLGHRKKKGAYYTPTHVVKKLLTHLYKSVLMTDGQDVNILDPCCGTGNFLLQLPPGIPRDNVYGSDIDEDSLKIARINLALKYDHADAAFWKEHITYCDFLEEGDGSNKTYDVILGNPPWGYDFSASEKASLKSRFLSAACVNPESYDLFCEQGVKRLNPSGHLAFVLPESLLSVNSHKEIRNFLLANTHLIQVEYLGEVFDRVQCPSVIMQVKKPAEPESNSIPSAFLSEGPVIYEAGRKFTIEKDRPVNSDYFDFLTSKEEYDLLLKIENLPDSMSLKDNADFALGIVTGSNKDMLKSRKSSNNEIILKGSDIFKYRYRIPKCYINYRPELCQQTAPLKYYRAPQKLLYRFISSGLIFAYDDRKTLSLNSCNILIPHIKGYDIRYILAILNSSVLDYYFRKRFRSVKVLKSHLEKLPIPSADIVTRQRIVSLADRLINDDPRSEEVYALLDRQIAELFNLSKDEYEMITIQLNEQE